MALGFYFTPNGFTPEKYDEAIGHYRWALEMNPAHSDAHLNLAIALKQSGRSEEAEPHLMEASRLQRRGAP